MRTSVDMTKHLAYWLRQLHPDSTYARLVFQGAWRTGPDGELIKGKWSETQIDPSNGAVDVILSRPDCNTFVSPAQVSGHDDASFISSRAVWADVDPDSPDEFTDQWRTMVRPVAESLGAMIVASGRGYHVYLMLDEALRDAQRLRRLNSALTQLLRGDRSSVNPSRVLRVPGTYHCKTDRRPVVRVIKKPTRHWSVEELEAELAPQMRDAPLLAGPLDEEWRTVDVSHVNKALTFSIRQRGEESGDRSELCYWAIRECQEKGLTRDEAHTLLSEFAPGVSKYRSRWHKEIDRIWAKQTPGEPEMSDSPFEEAAVEELDPDGGTLADVKLRDVEWWWPGFIPKRKTILLAGRSGIGKSTLILDIIARLTTGEPFPDQEGRNKPINVGYMASEDDADDTIGPRCLAAGVDLSRVRLPNPNLEWALPTHIPLLRQWIRKCDIQVLVIDAITDFRDEAKDDEHHVRKLLRPLRELAAEEDITIILVKHFNKNGEFGEGVMRVSGATAWVDATRGTLIMGCVDPNGVGVERWLANDKINYWKDKNTWRFNIESANVKIGNKTSSRGRVDWVELREGMSADTAARQIKTGTPTKQDDAITFLEAKLADGKAHRGSEIKEEGVKLGFSARTIDRAIAHMCTADPISAKKVQRGREVFWKLLVEEL